MMVPDGVPASSLSGTFDSGDSTRTTHELLPVKIISLSVGAISLCATVAASYLFLSMRRSFRHDLILLLLLGDFLKGVCFITYPIASLAVGLRRIPLGSPFCEVNGYLLTVGTEASDVAVLIIALHTALSILRPRWRGGDNGLYPYRHCAYVFFVMYPMVNAAMAYAKGAPGFADSGEFCYLPVREAWYRSYLAWIPRYIIFSLIVVLYTCLVIFVRYSQRQYEQDESTPRAPHSQRCSTPTGSHTAPPTPRIARHGLLPDTPSNTSSRRGSRETTTLSKDRRWSQGSLWSVKTPLVERRGHGLRVPSITVQEAAASDGERRSSSAADQGANPEGVLGLDADPSGRTGHVNWTWTETQGSHYKSRSRRYRSSDRPVSPTSVPSNPFFPTLPERMVAPSPPPRAVSFSREDQPETLHAPGASPLKSARSQARRSSSSQSLMTTLRSSRSGRWTSDETLSPVPNREYFSVSSLLTHARSRPTALRGSARSSTAASEEVTQMRLHIRTQLRLLFVYPLVYITLWFVPFLSHVMGYDDANQRSDPMWVVSLSMASLSVQGAVNAALFLVREKPWRQRDPRGFWGGLRDRVATAASDDRQWYSWMVGCWPCYWAQQGRRAPAGSGRSRQQMREDGRQARSRRDQEVLMEERMAATKRAAGASKAAGQGVPNAITWWDAEIERVDALRSIVGMDENKEIDPPSAPVPD